MAEGIVPERSIARRGAALVRSRSLSAKLGLVALLALVAAAALVLRLGPLALWVYNVEQAGRAMDEGLVWPEPRQVDSLPRIRDNRALERGLSHLAAAVRWRPDHPHAYRLAGQIYAAREEWVRSAEAFDRARELAPKNPLLAWEASLAYEQMQSLVESAPATSLLGKMAAGQIETPSQPVQTPFCRPGRPESCHLAEVVFALPYAAFADGLPHQAPALFLHPPAKVRQTLAIPPDQAGLRFLLGLDPEAQGWGSDGATFQVWVEPPSGPAALVYEGALDAAGAQSGWLPGWADLSPWAGQTVTLVLAAGPGPTGDAAGDWYGWGDLALTTVEAARFAALLPEARMRAAWRAGGFDAQQFLGRGLSAEQAERFEEALVWYRRSLRLDPWAADTWYRVGLAHQRLEQWDQALAAYERAAELSPGNRDAWYGLGQAHAARREWEAALAAYERGLDGTRGLTGPSALYFRIARIRQSYLNPPDREGAWRAYEQALELDSFAPYEWLKADTHYQRGVLLAEQRRWSEAEEEYRRALALNPRHYWAHVTLARALLELGRVDEAREAAEQGIELDPQRKAAYSQLAAIYSSVGDVEKAREMYARVLELDPNDTRAREALEALESRSISP